ncbi:hypothetical protein SAMN05421595_0689 [Austwickia chelonae]|uniref:Uncharacterized protein n=1 Tax=Austwickia chelonae NBRC 105200 TaxID=1184607 RepID=K6V7H2_9MICO|nr:hypothetical protein [Austwickia chelonae]GAB78168.1 hypothetical protein AUCHE_08_04130 [Austwickia chelonae NBRC 105200]SEV98091.1 hypothetical protein SAMN05421595_0689 [Austwickia chelonae]
MAGDMELEVGAQRMAATVVRGGVPDVHAVLVRVADAVKAQSTGFRGQAASALAGEVSEWLVAASDLVPALVDYADALAQVDALSAATESSNVQGLRSSASSGGSPVGGFSSGLRME